MKHKYPAWTLLAMAPFLTLLPDPAQAQTPAPRVAKQPPARATPRATAAPRKAPPAAKKRQPPARRAATAKRPTPAKVALPKARAATARRTASPRPAKRARPEPSALQKKLRGKLKKIKKAKKDRKKPPVARIYIGADLSIFPGVHTSREIQGIAAEATPRTAAIRALHGSSLRFIQGLHLMNSTLDIRFAVGLSNLIPVGGKRALWGSDFGLGGSFRIYRFAKRVDLSFFNAYRLLIVSSLDNDLNGIGLHLEVGLSGTYHINRKYAVEIRLGYSRQQLRYRKNTTAQVGGLETPSGVLFKSDMFLLNFAFLHFR